MTHRKHEIVCPPPRSSGYSMQVTLPVLRKWAIFRRGMMPQCLLQLPPASPVLFTSLQDTRNHGSSEDVSVLRDAGAMAGSRSGAHLAS